jgi:hypothetical protein
MPLSAFKYPVAFVFGLLTAGCSVPISEVPGTYDAKYPFATEVLTLNGDGTLTQQIQLAGKSAAVTSHGTWYPDPGAPGVGTRLQFKSILIVADGFGRLDPHWRTPTTAFMTLTRIGFWMTMGDGGGYGWRKRWR